MHIKINDFNSHAHVERDYSVNSCPIVIFDFNSHAHVERDLSFAAQLHCLSYFNSHAHVERDAWKSRCDLLSSTFQLTRSRGA